ncbi:WAT1-related protein isoform X2 [Tanacetum coccineum]
MSNLSPAFTFVLAYFFRMERIHLRSYTIQAKIIGTIVSISGAVIATLYSGPSLLSSNISMNWIVGGVLLASQYFLLAFALVAQAKILQVYSVDLMVVFVFGLSGLFVAGFAALVMANDVEAWKLKSNAVLITVLYMGFFSGFFNVVAQIWVLRLRGPVYVAMFKPLTIVIAVIMGVLFLGDSLHLGRFHPKWDAPEQVDLTGDVPGATQEDLFGHDARPRPAGKPRPAKKTKSDATASTGGSSASTQFGELMEQELRLKREAAERAFEAQAEKDRTLMRLEELRFLATSTKDLDDDDAYWIKKQKKINQKKMRNDLGDEDDEDEDE